jgi:hypothetical protein
MVDDRRRIVMPQECPPHSAVTIQQLDTNTWIVKRQTADRSIKLVPFKIIEQLPDDPEWDKTELALAVHAAKNLPEPE